jgi:predicted nucleic acid-binding protein
VLLRDLRVEFVEPDTMMLARAGELAVDHRITIYDAVFAALADHLDCELVTADRKLIESGACRMRGLAD